MHPKLLEIIIIVVIIIIHVLKRETSKTITLTIFTQSAIGHGHHSALNELGAVKMDLCMHIKSFSFCHP